MRQYIQSILIGCVMMMSFASCIDEYTLPDSTESRVVIFGQIVSQSDCVFTLRSTIAPNGIMTHYAYIRDAEVRVMGTDGQVFEGYAIQGEDGRYVVPVGRLDGAHRYYLHVSTIYGDFESEPMQPLDAPELVELVYDQPREDRKVDVMVSTTDPHALTYLLWQVDEYWEIRTPFTARWEFQPDMSEHTGSFVRLSPEQYTNHGWRYSSGLTDFATNQDYANGAITRRCIYQRSNKDHRFQNRCLMRIRQMAITRDEFEYRNLMKRQAADVGGLFAQMPSELPTNIRSSGETKAIGYIGVRGTTSMREMYINASDVDYVNTDEPDIIDKGYVVDPFWMVNAGYAVYSHDENTGETVWTYDWCVDYRSAHWGGSEAMERPDFWIDK